MKTTVNRAVVALVILFLAKWNFGENTPPEKSVASPGVVFELLALNHDLATAARPKYRSPCAFASSPDSQFLYVAEQNSKRISVVDLKAQKLVKSIQLPNEATGIAVSDQTGLIYVTCSSDIWPDGMVCVVDREEGKVRSRHLPGGQGARSPVISHDGKTLYVCNQHGDNVYVDNIETGTLVTIMGAMREPYSAALTPDDSVLVVANCLPVQKATDTLRIASKILLFDAKAMKLRDTLAMPTVSHSVFGMTISPDGQFAFTTHLMAMFAIPATQVTGGWIHTNNVCIVDIKKRKIINDVTLDSPAYGAGNPWGIDCTPDGKLLCVAHSGSNELSVIDIPPLIALAETSDYSPDPLTAPTEKVTLSHDLSALRKISKKIRVVGKAPRAMKVIGNKAYTAGYFADYIEIFDLYSPQDTVNSTQADGTIDLEPDPDMTSERKGECAYFDASLCFQKWQSCQSCHPLTRTDGLNWTLNSDLSFPKNAKSMLYSWWTPPTSWAAKRVNAYESIVAGFRSELFLEPNWGLALCMDTFFMKLKPVPSPYLVKGKLSNAAERGREVFLRGRTLDGTTLDCKRCHPPPLYTDLKQYNSGIWDPYDVSTNWDTPTLVESWRGAPYNHLGSMDQMPDILRYKSHSNAGGLSPDDFNNLVEFVLSL